MGKDISNERRFIEVAFPIKEVSKESSKERNIRDGHISTLHLWWSRKPLSSSRATTYAALIPYPSTENEVKEKTEFIIELSKWKNSLMEDVIRKAREDILRANGGKPLKVLDPFAGGGSIPLECLRLGLEPHAGEYNPVAALILKCTLEYPQKYGGQNKVKRNEGLFNIEKAESPLIADIRKWGEWVLEQARKEIGRFYPEDEDGSIPLGYYWMRTIPCQNPSCKAEIPLTANWWLVRKKDEKVFLYPFVYNGKVEFAIVQRNGDEWQVVESSVPGFIPKVPSNFDPDNGTVSRAFAVCPVCKSTIEDNQVRKLFQEEKAGQRMVVVILSKSGKRVYRLATEKDVDLYKNAEEYLEVKRKKLLGEWGFDPVPDEDFSSSVIFSTRLYKLTMFGDLFNARQKLALIVFTEKVRLAYKKMIEEGYDKEYAKVVLTYLGFGVSRLAEYTSNLCFLDSTLEKVSHVFSRQSLHMVWDYSEVNPLSKAVGSWTSMVLRRILLSLSHLTQIPPIGNVTPNVYRSSATELPYPDNYFDAVFTDPPYYDNVPYSHLSDFFYVWLKRSIGDLYPELFSTPLTPKSEEIVAYSKRGGGSKALKLMKDDGRMCLNIPLDKNKGGQQSVYADIITIAKKVGWKYHSTIVWNEGNISRRTAWGSWLSPSAPYVIAPVEMIAVLYKKRWKKQGMGESDITKEEFIEWTNGIWTFPGESKKRVNHPAPFPLELPKRCIKLFTYVGDTVLDPFLGSGTTLVACALLNRRGIGVEIDKNYCEIAKNRLIKEGKVLEDNLFQLQSKLER